MFFHFNRDVTTGLIRRLDFATLGFCPFFHPRHTPTYTSRPAESTGLKGLKAAARAEPRVGPAGDPGLIKVQEAGGVGAARVEGAAD